MWSRKEGTQEKGAAKRRRVKSALSSILGGILKDIWLKGNFSYGEIVKVLSHKMSLAIKEMP